MTSEQNNNQLVESLPEKFSWEQMWQVVKKHRRLYYMVLPATFVIIALCSLSLPNYYKCTVKLAPELAGSKGGGSLSNLASSLGFNMATANSGADAIMPTLYPDLMNSVTFKASLFDVKVQREEEDTSMTYYEYLLNNQKSPWWSAAIKGLMSLLPKGESDDKGNGLNPFRLTKEQSGIIEVMNQKVVCDVDKKTLVITIDVTDQDPLIAATMADSVQVHLQDFITEYRTRKARIDLAYNQKLFKEAKERYEKARKRSAIFNDANQKVFLERVRSERNDLENEMQLQFRTYSQVAAQLQMAEAKVQEDTPAFTLLQPATVPVKKSGPRRSMIVLAYLFLAVIITTIYILYKENAIRPLFNMLFNGDDEETGPGQELHLGDGDYYILSKYPPQSHTEK